MQVVQIKLYKFVVVIVVSLPAGYPWQRVPKKKLVVLVVSLPTFFLLVVSLLVFFSLIPSLKGDREGARGQCRGEGAMFSAWLHGCVFNVTILHVGR